MRATLHKADVRTKSTILQYGYWSDGDWMYYVWRYVDGWSAEAWSENLGISLAEREHKHKTQEDAESAAIRLRDIWIAGNEALSASDGVIRGGQS